jgi:hypothetical protein
MYDAGPVYEGVVVVGLAAVDKVAVGPPQHPLQRHRHALLGLRSAPHLCYNSIEAVEACKKFRYILE